MTTETENVDRGAFYLRVGVGESFGRHSHVNNSPRIASAWFTDHAPTASAPASLPLSAAAEHQRFTERHNPAC